MTTIQTPQPAPQKLFYPPGTIEELEEEERENLDEAKSKADTETPLLSPNVQKQYTVVNVPPITKVHTSPSLARISTATSLPRNSTWNSSLYQGQGSIRGSRRSFRFHAARKMRRRAVFKNGDCNILQSRISKRRLRFLQDIFTTLVDSQWRWTLTIFAMGFLGSWLLFALIWWLIAFTHGDLEEEHLPLHQADANWAPCVLNIHGFTSCFLFSIETQHTIGYGVRTTTEECPEAIFIMCLQSIAGMIIQAFMVGIVFAKMTRPKLRTQTLQFSKNSVICQREGFLSLMFRVGDMRKSHIIGASIRAQLIRAKRTKEGEILNNFQTELMVNADGCDGNLFFIWPMTIVHRIDDKSPFYHMSAADMLHDRFEVVVILEGTIESTGQTTQARSSYLASEVLWGHRFEPVVAYNKDRQGYEVNYSKFDNTVAVDTPLCSAAELAQFYKMQEDSPQSSRKSPAFRQSPFRFLLDPPPQKPVYKAQEKTSDRQPEEYYYYIDSSSPQQAYNPYVSANVTPENAQSQPGCSKEASEYDFPVSQKCHDIPEEGDEVEQATGKRQQCRV